MRAIRTRSVCSLATLCTLVLLAGCADDPPAIAPLNPVTGRVVDASGTPVVAELLLVSTDAYGPYVRSEGTTDAEGTFVLTSRVRGPHLLWAMRGLALAGVIELTPPTSGIELVVRPTGRIRGHLSREGGSEGHEFRATVDHSPDTLMVVADSSGDFVLTGIPPGRRVIWLIDNWFANHIEYSIADTVGVLVPPPPDTARIADYVFPDWTFTPGNATARGPVGPRAVVRSVERGR